eukprot:TRINITY_DN13423_c0_g1_i1.p1 TRINITY_DN13423_c0_g1~~TRINITY_DN13423_c0_g1_i1.p1  ORF type:complete len:509 (-),score=174.05 TRINITY_DN13423_c0_g1_i1:49-1575(-)
MFLRMLPRASLTLMVVMVLLLCLLITSFNIWTLSSMQAQHFTLFHSNPTSHQPTPSQSTAPTYLVYAKHPDSGYLKHVYNVLERDGYVRGDFNTSTNWDVMWAHDYPFKKIRDRMLKLKPGQRVNKFPGSGYITNKVNLATSGLKNVPQAFQLPKEKDLFLEYAKIHPNKMFVQKSNNHRGIQIEKISNLKLDAEGSFVQEFIDNPLLVDGYKFDIGLYTTLTSIDPLRVYVHDTDVLLRFCPTKYHPFDASDKDKYVVQDDYLPSWQVPSFTKYMGDTAGFSFKDTLNAYVTSLGKDPNEMWDQIYQTIVDVYRSQEDHFIRATSHYPHKEAFFEMVRFDFVIDDQLNVYLMEANMSPNLSSAHFPANALLYEQVVHSVLRLVGVVGRSVSAATPSKPEKDMQVSDKDVLVSPATCVTTECLDKNGCQLEQCELCKKCLSREDVSNLRRAWLERRNQFATRRIFPHAVSMKQARSENKEQAELGDSNRKMAKWYKEKCLMDKTWCDN